ncbi:MAG: DUF6011 domain-containing protein [Crocinitomicaceae bacterium]
MSLSILTTELNPESICGEEGAYKLFVYKSDKRFNSLSFIIADVDSEDLDSNKKRHWNFLGLHIGEYSNDSIIRLIQYIIELELNLFFMCGRLKNCKFRFPLFRNSVNHIILFKGSELLVDTRDHKFKRFWSRLRLNYLVPTQLNSDNKKIPDFQPYFQTLKDLVAFSADPLFINEDKTLTSLIQKENVKSINELTLRQKVLLLQGMMESNARKLAEVYFTEGKLNEIQLKAVDDLIERAIKKYGTELIYTLLELPDKPFHIRDAQRILYKPKRAGLHDDSIELIGVDGSIFKLFFKKTDSSISLKSNDLTVATISSNGEVRFETGDKKKRMVTANMILSYVNDPIGSIVYFGAQTGSCSFCDKPLTDPRSKISGYGRQCAKINDLLWG